MTRQLFILILTTFIVVAGGLWETKYLENSSNFVLSDIDYIKNAIINDNFSVAKKQSNELEKSWKNIKDSWNIFVQNDLTDEIEDSLLILKSYIENEEKVESIVHTEILKANIKDIVKRQKVKFENVF